MFQHNTNQQHKAQKSDDPHNLKELFKIITYYNRTPETLLSLHTLSSSFIFTSFAVRATHVCWTGTSIAQYSVATFPTIETRVAGTFVYGI